MFRSIRMSLTITACLAFGIPSGGLTAEEAVDPSRLEYEQLLEIMRNAKPAPNPPRATPLEVASDEPEQRWAVEYDPVTGEERVISEVPVDLSRVPESDPGFLGTPPLSITEAFDSLNVGTEGDRGITPTPPTPRTNAQGQPWNTVYKLLMRFDVGGTDYFYVCSAFSVGDFHLGTAGHCIYNWDPNDNGDTSDAKWADEVWAWAAQMDDFHPTGEPERPYGVAKSVYLRSYTGWTQSQNYDHDWAVIVMNRRMGARTGWLGRGSSLANSLNFSGYPTETPYVPAGTLVQYYGYDAFNVDSNTDYRIQLDAFIYGGHSGGPSWKYDGTDRWNQGIHSTSNRVGSAWDTYLNEDKRDRINTWIADDESIRPPVARPDMIEHRLDTEDRKQLYDTTVEQGGTFSAEFNMLNAGHSPATNLEINFYLSTNDNITEFDYLVGTRTWSTFNEWTYTNQTTDFTVPLSVPPGSYYFGWIASTSNTEYESGDNTVLISDQMLTVTAASPNLCEPDLTLSCESGDSWGVDWAGSTDAIDDYSCNGFNYAGPEYAYEFTAPSSGPVTVTLSGLTADLDLLILGGPACDPDTCLEASASGGTTDEQITFMATAGTTYFIVVDGFNGNVGSYDIYVSCGGTIFTDGFESGNTSAWSGSVG